MNHYEELKIEFDKFSNYDEFKDNIVVKKAIVLDFIQIGENVNKLSDEVKNKINKLDIRGVIDFRNRLVHGYGNIDYKIVYNTIKNSLPSLISQLSDYFITEYNCNITKINESV
jgi:uncharacterized protein with HEPN domain